MATKRRIKPLPDVSSLDELLEIFRSGLVMGVPDDLPPPICHWELGTVFDTYVVRSVAPELGKSVEAMALVGDHDLVRAYIEIDGCVPGWYVGHKGNAAFLKLRVLPLPKK